MGPLSLLFLGTTIIVLCVVAFIEYTDRRSKVK